LVLDDLDKTRPTPVAAEQLFLAIDHRIENRVPLAVTTNLSLAEIATRYEQPFGEAIASRLAGYCARHTITGVDRRMAS
jgi:DNA replication protein DnaC